MLSNCTELVTIKSVLSLYEENKIHVDDLDIDSLLNAFLYLLENFNDDESFEFMYYQFGGHCDAKKCISFQRNNRERTSDAWTRAKELYDSVDSNEIIKQQIMDKLHCYFRHYFRSVKNDDSQNDEKQSQISNRFNLKYNQIEHIQPKQRYPDEDNIYCVGYMFFYGYDGEKRDRIREVRVFPKYQSLKEELIFNDIHSINIQQFNNEYEKAQIYFNSVYCKRYIKEILEKIYSEDFIATPTSLSVEHLLSLMIYTNYDQLQYAFSKTYRDNEGKEHCNFFYLGMFLKISVNTFGTTTK
eukprot:306452_1